MAWPKMNPISATPVTPITHFLPTPVCHSSTSSGLRRPGSLRIGFTEMSGLSGGAVLGCSHEQTSGWAGDGATGMTGRGAGAGPDAGSDATHRWVRGANRVEDAASGPSVVVRAGHDPGAVVVDDVEPVASRCRSMTRATGRSPAGVAWPSAGWWRPRCTGWSGSGTSISRVPTRTQASASMSPLHDHACRLSVPNDRWARTTISRDAIRGSLTTCTSRVRWSPGCTCRGAGRRPRSRAGRRRARAAKAGLGVPLVVEHRPRSTAGEPSARQNWAKPPVGWYLSRRRVSTW